MEKEMTEKQPESGEAKKDPSESEAEKKPPEAETKPSEAETKPSEAETKPSEAEKKHPEAEKKDMKVDCRYINLKWNMRGVQSNLLRKLVNQILFDPVNAKNKKEAKPGNTKIKLFKDKPSWWPEKIPFTTGGGRKKVEGTTKHARLLKADDLREIITAFQRYIKEKLGQGFTPYNMCKSETVQVNYVSEKSCKMVRRTAATAAAEQEASNDAEDAEDADEFEEDDLDASIFNIDASEINNLVDLRDDVEVWEPAVGPAKDDSLIHIHDNRVGCCSILQGMNRLRLARFLCDIELICQGARFPVHKCVLAASSPLFQELFQNYTTVKEYNISGLECNDLVELADFLYTGQIAFNKDNVQKWKLIAGNLQISALENAIKGYVLNKRKEREKAKLLEAQQEEDGKLVETKWVIKLASPNKTCHNYCQPSYDLSAGPLKYNFVKKFDENEETRVPDEDADDTVMDDFGAPENDDTGELPADLNNDQTQTDGENDAQAKKRKSYPRSDAQKQTRGGKRTCPYCPEEYILSGREMLRRHVNEKHKDEMPSCPFCGNKFTVASGLERHEDNCRIKQTLDAEGWYNCPDCIFKNKKCVLVVRHYRVEHTNKYFKVCDFTEDCGLEFRHYNDYFEHLIQIHGVTEENNIITAKIHKCSECDFRTALGVSKLRHHYTRTHCEKLICELCSKDFVDEGTLRTHQKTVHSDKPREYKFECDQDECGKKFRNRGAYDSHMYTNHKMLTTKKGIIHKCPLCDYMAVRRKNINLHYRGVHLKEMRYTCNLCMKAFKSQPQLKNHLRKHKGEKPFKCKLCDYATHAPSCLKNHMIHIHGTEKKYMCDYCGFKTKGPGNLMLHKRRCKRKFEANEPTELIGHMATKRQMQQERRFLKKAQEKKPSAPPPSDHVQFNMHLSEVYEAALQLEQHDQGDPDSSDNDTSISEVTNHDEQVHWHAYDAHNALELS